MPPSMGSDFELLGEVTDIEIIAVNLAIREHRRSREQFGGRRWRPLKGVGRVCFPNGEIRLAKLHRYEIHGISRRNPNGTRRGVRTAPHGIVIFEGSGRGLYLGSHADWLPSRDIPIPKLPFCD
jgi:hypothetical protein